MSNARLLYNSLFEQHPTVGITASTAVAGYPATNLVTPNYAETWRSGVPGVSSETIVFDFLTDVTASCIMLGNVNLRSTAEIHIQANATDSWGSPTLDYTVNAGDLDPTSVVSAPTDGYARNVGAEFSSTTKRFWRLTVKQNLLYDGFIEIGNVFLGVPVTLNDNYDAVFARRLIRGNVELRTEYDQAYVYARDHAWQFDLSWTNCQEATINQLRALTFNRGGNSLPFYFVLDPTDPEEAYYVRLVGDIEEARVYYDRYNTKMQLLEETPGLVIPR